MIEKRNIGHSVFVRLKNYATTNRADLTLVLIRYGVERLLYRLSRSEHSKCFVLKGASLFLVWTGQSFRITKDADLMGYGIPDVEELAETFRELCKFQADHGDGIIFDAESVQATSIREDNEYDGIRIRLNATIHHARIGLQVDIGFGDAITPEPQVEDFPTLLDSPPPRIRAYSRYTVVAEKFEAMVTLGLANSRMKDFYDLWLMSRIFEFDQELLATAIRHTFEQRGVTLPTAAPIALTDEFSMDEQKMIQWKAFIRKTQPDNPPDSLQEATEEIWKLLKPVLQHIS